MSEPYPPMRRSSKTRLLGESRPRPWDGLRPSAELRARRAPCLVAAARTWPAAGRDRALSKHPASRPLGLTAQVPETFAAQTIRSAVEQPALRRGREETKSPTRPQKSRPAAATSAVAVTWGQLGSENARWESRAWCAAWRSLAWPGILPEVHAGARPAAPHVAASRLGPGGPEPRSWPSDTPLKPRGSLAGTRCVQGGRFASGLGPITYSIALAGRGVQGAPPAPVSTVSDSERSHRLALRTWSPAGVQLGPGHAGGSTRFQRQGCGGEQRLRKKGCEARGQRVSGWAGETIRGEAPRAPGRAQGRLVG